MNIFSTSKHAFRTEDRSRFFFNSCNMQNGSIGYGVFSTIQNKVDFCLKVNKKRFCYFLKWNNAEPTKIGLIKNPYLQEMFS